MSGLGMGLLRKTVAEVDTWIHRLDGRTKFLFFLWISGFAYLFCDYAVTAFFLAVCLVLAAYARVLRPIGLTLLVIVVPWIAVNAVILGLPFGFPWNETVIFEFELFGMRIPVYYEGLSWAVTWPLRIGVTISAAMLFFLTTNQARLIATLIKLKVPFRFIYMVIATLQMIPMLMDEANTIYQAQVSRGLRTDVGLLKRALHYFALMVPLTLSTLYKVQVRAIALESRGFSAPVKKTLLHKTDFDKADYMFFAAMALATIGLLYIYFTYGFSPIAHMRYYIAG
mgnify:CR=1 FL=1